MINIQGKYNTAKFFTSSLEKLAVDQLTALCNQSLSKVTKLRIMPYDHAGAGCVKCYSKFYCKK